MDYEGKESKHMEMKIINNVMLTCYYLDVIIPGEDEDGEDFKDKFFIGGTSRLSSEKTCNVGTLLYDFITADFLSAKGFREFVDNWGFSGLLKINEKNNPDYTPGAYSKEEIDKLIANFHGLCKDTLIHAQADFKDIVDFLVNNNKEECLKDLTSIQKYHVGIKKGLISGLDHWSGLHYTTYNIGRDYSNCSNALEEVKAEANYSIKELCTVVKTDSLSIDASYYSQDIISLVYIEFFNVLKNFSLSKCENCNKYFIPKTRYNEVYCEDCRLIGYKNKIQNDVFLKAYNTAYKTKHSEMMRKTRGKKNKNTAVYEDALEKWRENARIKLKEAQEGKISLDNFKEFLKKRLEV